MGDRSEPPHVENCRVVAAGKQKCECRVVTETSTALERRHDDFCTNTSFVVVDKGMGRYDTDDRQSAVHLTAVNQRIESVHSMEQKRRYILSGELLFSNVAHIHTEEIQNVQKMSTYIHYNISLIIHISSNY